MTFTASSASGRARPARAGRRALLIATSVALVSGALLPAAGSASAAPARAHQAAAPVEEYDISLLTGDVVHYTDGAGKQDTVTVDRPDGATVTALGADPGGRPHPYRMALAGPGAQVRLLDTLAPAIEADLAAVREDRRAPGGPGTPGLPVTNG